MCTVSDGHREQHVPLNYKQLVYKRKVIYVKAISLIVLVSEICCCPAVALLRHLALMCIE